MGVFEETSSNINQFGFRIYKLVKDGPLHKGGVKELTDFIIPPEEVLQQRNTFKDWILSIADQTVKLRIYSLLTNNYKTIEIKTNKSDSKDGVLGAGVKFENFENANKKLLHVTSVLENSFAKDKLKLIPDEDYIIAVKGKDTRILSLNIEDYNPLEILNMIISNNKGKNLIFYIYNKHSGSRNVEVLIDNEDNFTLGCDVAYGALHEFPKEQNEIIEEMFKDNKNIEQKEDNKNVQNNNVENVGTDIKIEKEKDIIEEDII